MKLFDRLACFALIIFSTICFAVWFYTGRTAMFVLGLAPVILFGIMGSHVPVEQPVKIRNRRQ